jgi:plastocyanin
MKVSGILALALVAFLVTLGAGCGGDDGGGDTTTPTQATEPAGGAETTTVKMDEYSFDPEDASVKRGDTIEVTNDGAIAHNLTIEQGPDPKEKTKKLAGTSTFLPDKSERLELDVEPGKYAMVCTVSGHRELGMTGTITVR